MDGAAMPAAMNPLSAAASGGMRKDSFMVDPFDRLRTLERNWRPVGNGRPTVRSAANRSLRTTERGFASFPGKCGTLLLSNCLAGAGGFEPPNGGIKIRCLTTWLRPTTGGDPRNCPFGPPEHSRRLVCEQRFSGFGLANAPTAAGAGGRLYSSFEPCGLMRTSRAGTPLLRDDNDRPDCSDRDRRRLHRPNEPAGKEERAHPVDV